MNISYRRDGDTLVLVIDGKDVEPGANVAITASVLAGVIHAVHQDGIRQGAIAPKPRRRIGFGRPDESNVSA